MLFKGDPKLNSLTLTVAGVAGALTGASVQSSTLLAQVGISVGVGLVVGGLLYALIRVVRRRDRPS